MPEISVIVPVYKVENYLESCINSILEQTFSDFELILVDDGSPDKCGFICDHYKAVDHRIHVIHRENGGLSAARNSGMDIAIGRYITFVDSDDLIPNHYLEILYKHMSDTDSDIAVCGFNEFQDRQTEGESLIADSNHCFQNNNRDILTSRETCIRLYTPGSNIPINAWGKLFKKTVLGNLRFPEGRLHEDQAMIPIACYQAKRIVRIYDTCYLYRNNPESITKSRFNLRRYDDLWAVDQCITYFGKAEEPQIVSAAKSKREILRCVYAIYACRDKLIIPSEYKVSMWHAFTYLRPRVSKDKYQYYLAQVYPRYVLFDARIRKLESIVGITN